MLTFYTHRMFATVSSPVKGRGEDYITELGKFLTLVPGTEFALKIAASLSLLLIRLRGKGCLGCFRITQCLLITDRLPAPQGFQFSRSAVGPAICISNQPPVAAGGADLSHLTTSRLSGNLDAPDSNAGSAS